MATYFVDDGGDGSDGLTWAKAYVSLQALDTAVAFASGDIVYIGADTNSTDAAASLTITGPTFGLPVNIISSTVGAGTTVSYSAGTGDQILATGGTSDVTFDGSFSLNGIRIKAGRNIISGVDNNESFHAKQCKFVVGANGSVLNSAASGLTQFVLIGCTVDLTADGTTDRTAAPVGLQNSVGANYVIGMTFINPAYRTGNVFNTASTGYTEISGVDLSGFTNATLCEIVSFDVGMVVRINNCLTAGTWGLVNTALTPYPRLNIFAANVGSADDPTSMFHYNYFGAAVSSAAIYRSGGATVEGDATSWLVTTRSTCSETSPFESPWIYGTTTNGSKTFDVFITNDTADFTDAGAWLEVEYLSTADEAIWALADDHRVITTTAANQTDDVASTWNGAGPSYTYKQKLSVTATVGETGQYRARVVVGLASIASSRYFYVDPLVTVS